jgi:enterochelin esterase-like enzyme
VTTWVPYRPLPVDQSDVRYRHGPDSSRRPEVPEGVTHAFRWTSSGVYPGTSRTVWVHVPAAYRPGRPAALMVFQDGWWYLDPDGEVRAAVVLDNLVHAGDIPVTLGVFVDPGVVDEAGVLDDRVLPSQRNVEYDGADDRYATFLLDEIIPEATQEHPVDDDPSRWGLCGGSSGGSCAFTAAWWRPDRFRQVVAFLPSFAQMQGGDPYPELVRDQPRLPLRVFLQAGHRDLGWDRAEYNWLASTLRVSAALAESGYDFRLVLGDGGHSPNHGGVLLPDALRWLWRDGRS